MLCYWFLFGGALGGKRNVIPLLEKGRKEMRMLRRLWWRRFSDEDAGLLLDVFLVTSFFAYVSRVWWCMLDLPENPNSLLYLLLLYVTDAYCLCMVAWDASSFFFTWALYIFSYHPVMTSKVWGYRLPTLPWLCFLFDFYELPSIFVEWWLSWTIRLGYFRTLLPWMIVELDVMFLLPMMKKFWG